MSPLPLSARAVVPLLSSSDVRRSIAFYEKLGFRVANSFAPEGADGPVWASLVLGSAEIMLG